MRRRTTEVGVDTKAPVGSQYRCAGKLRGPQKQRLDLESGGEALAVKVWKKVPTKGQGEKPRTSKDIRKCFLCKESGHLKKDCPKRLMSRNGRDNTKGTNMMLMVLNSIDTVVDRENWYVDNGATSHVTMRKDLFQDFEYFGDSHTVTTADGNVINAIGKGSIHVVADVNGKYENINLRDVWYVPQISKNLFSVLSTQDRNPTSLFESHVTTCQIKIGGRITAKGNRVRYGGLYKLILKTIPPVVSINLVDKIDMLQLYHERMGHQNKKHVKKIIERELGIKTADDGNICEGCIFGKAHRLKFGVRERTKQPGEIIHTDICGPFTNSKSKYRYFCLFKDDFTRYRHIYFLREKSEAKAKLEQMLAESKVAGHTVKELLSDNGGEFDNENVRNILNRNGVKQRLIMPYTPEQNGCSERDNRTIVESARAMMYAHEELPQYLWAELVSTAIYVINRTGPTNIENKSPYELWFNKKPQIKHLRIIGSSCYAHVPKQRRKKMQKKAAKCILIGYDNYDGYRLWNKVNNTLVRSRDVIFNEKLLGRKNEIDVPLRASTYNKTSEGQNEIEISLKPLTSDSILEEASAEENLGEETVSGTAKVNVENSVITPAVDDGEFNDGRSVISEESIEYEGK